MPVVTEAKTLIEAIENAKNELKTEKIIYTKKEKTIKYVNKWQKLLITFAVFSRCLNGYRGIIILRNVGIL